MKSRVMQGYHLIRQRRWRRLGTLVSPAALLPGAQAEIWRDIAEHYVVKGFIAEADAAYGLGLAACPKAFHLRVARRRLPGRRIILPGEHRLALEHALREKLGLKGEPRYVSSEQVMGGTSGNTDLIARHVFREEGEGAGVSLIEKRLYSQGGAASPREARLATFMSGDVGGRYFRFPLVYAVLDSPRQRTSSVYMEDLGVFPKVSRDDDALSLRARALGEFARYFSDTGEGGLLSGGKPMQAGRLLTAQDLRVFEGLVPDALVAGAADLLRCVTASGFDSEDFPEIDLPSKGDANGSNLPIHEDGKVVFIDNGAVGVTPVGRDIASMLSHYFQRMFFRSSVFRRLSETSSGHFIGSRHLEYARRAEDIAFRSYLEGGKLGDLGVTERMIRRGYAKYLLHSLYQRHVRPIRLKRDDSRASAATTALDDVGATLERAAMKKIVQITFALDRVAAQTALARSDTVRS